MSMGDPRVFDSLEMVVEDLSTGKTYTPSEFRALFSDAGLPVARELAEHYIGFVQFVDPAHFPNVDVYAEKGSGIETVVGIGLHELSPGQLLDASTPFFTRDGDVNQEDLTNDAVVGVERDALLALQPDRQPGRRPLLAPERPGRPGAADRRRARAALPLQLALLPDRHPEAGSSGTQLVRGGALTASNHAGPGSITQ